jgi:quinol monooxygenase YgiN
MDRREFMAFVGLVATTSVLADPHKESGMYGLIVKLTVIPGRRDEMIGILKESAADMPGCFSYVVAKDSVDENTLWVTEVWDSTFSHDASVSLPSVKRVIPRAKEIVSSLEKIAVTSPVWGVGLPAVHMH